MTDPNLDIMTRTFTYGDRLYSFNYEVSADGVPSFIQTVHGSPYIGATFYVRDRFRLATFARMSPDMTVRVYRDNMAKLGKMAPGASLIGSAARIYRICPEQSAPVISDVSGGRYERVSFKTEAVQQAFINLPLDYQHAIIKHPHVWEAHPNRFYFLIQDATMVPSNDPSVNTWVDGVHSVIIFFAELRMRWFFDMTNYERSVFLMDKLGFETETGTFGHTKLIASAPKLDGNVWKREKSGWHPYKLDAKLRQRWARGNIAPVIVLNKPETTMFFRSPEERTRFVRDLTEDQREMVLRVATRVDFLTDIADVESLLKPEEGK